MGFRKTSNLLSRCATARRDQIGEHTLQRRAVAATTRGARQCVSPTRACKERSHPARDRRHPHRRQGNIDQRPHRSEQSRISPPHSVRLLLNGATRGIMFRRVTVRPVTLPAGRRHRSAMPVRMHRSPENQTTLHGGIDRQSPVDPMLRMPVSSLKRISKAASYPFSIVSVVSQSMHGSVMESPY